MTGAGLIIQTLREHGIDWMATLCGHGLDPLFHAAREAGMRLVDTRNEQTASYIADAWGRLTRRPGVCAVSSGVAHVNALTGVANAWFDHGPMLLISGAAATTTAGKGHFQDMDQAAIARQLCKFVRNISRPDEITATLNDALTATLTDPCGPAHLTVPMDVQNSEISATPPARPSPPRVSNSGNIDRVAAALATARSPVVIAGSEVFYSQTSAEMLRFCERCEVPVMTPIWDRGLVNTPSSVFAGVVGAATGGPAILAEADFILMAGAACDYRVGYLQPPAIRPDATVLRIESRWNALEEACRKTSLDARREWLAVCIARRDEFRTQIEARAEEQSRAGLHALHIIRAIETVLPSDPVLLIDGGSIGQWVHHLLCSNRYPGDWLTCGRSGVVGWGVGGGMAARLAFPKRPIILLSGDGAFTFNIADIESAVRQGLGFVAIVADDQGWGITRSGHVRQFGNPIASSLGPIAFDHVASALGARGVRAATPEAIEQELRRALELTEVTVIHVPIVGGNPA